MSTTDQILTAQLTGAARHHARRRPLTAGEHDAAVAALRELTAGRADLLAQVAGLLEGLAEGQPDEPLRRQAAQLCRDAGADEALIPQWIEEGPALAKRHVSPKRRPRGTAACMLPGLARKAIHWRWTRAGPVENRSIPGQSRWVWSGGVFCGRPAGDSMSWRTASRATASACATSKASASAEMVTVT